MPEMTIRDTADVLALRLASITKTNGYETDLGTNVLANQGRVISDSDIFKDTLNVVDEGVSWERENDVLVRTHTFVCQFFVVSDANKTLNDKIYDAMNDVETFLLGLKETALGVGRNANVKMGKAKALAWAHSENRDIALIELTLIFTQKIQ